MPQIKSILPPGTQSITQRTQPFRTPAAPSPAAAPAAPAGAVSQNNTVEGVATPPAGGMPGSKEGQTSRLAYAAKQEAAQRARQREFEQQRRQLEADRQAHQAELQELAELRGLKTGLKKDPYQSLLQAGYTPDELAQMGFQAPDPASRQAMSFQEEIQTLKATIEELKKGQEDSASEAMQAADRQTAHEVAQIVAADPSLEAMRAYGETATQAVVALIHEIFDKELVVISTEEAVAQIEEYLVDEAYKAAQLGKVKKKLLPGESATQPEGQAANSNPAPKENAIPTLSNRHAPSAAKPLTAAQRMARAIAIAEGRNPDQS